MADKLHALEQDATVAEMCGKVRCSHHSRRGTAKELRETPRAMNPATVIEDLQRSSTPKASRTLDSACHQLWTKSSKQEALNNISESNKLKQNSKKRNNNSPSNAGLEPQLW